jgi:hypothetical protein
MCGASQRQRGWPNDWGYEMPRVTAGTLLVGLALILSACSNTVTSPTGSAGPSAVISVSPEPPASPTPSASAASSPEVAVSPTPAPASAGPPSAEPVYLYVTPSPAFPGDLIAISATTSVTGGPARLYMASATVDFGDGSSTTATGSCTALLRVVHAYRHGGDFAIKVTAVSGCDPTIPVDLSAATATLRIYPAAPSAASRWPTCSTDQLHMSGVMRGAAAGSVDVLIRLQNLAASGCTLLGYPGLRLVSGTGRLLSTHTSHAIVAVNLLGPIIPHLVALSPHGYASFEVYYTDNPSGPTADEPYANACPTSASVRVVLPGTGEFGTALVALEACEGAVQVTPILPGPNGISP